MANNILGTLIGAAIDRSDGDSGVKGAAIGYLAEGALKLAVPVAVTLALGWAVQRGLRTALGAVSDQLGRHRAAVVEPTAR
jgi:hypothetical protein